MTTTLVLKLEMLFLQVYSSTCGSDEDDQCEGGGGGIHYQHRIHFHKNFQVDHLTILLYFFPFSPDPIPVLAYAMLIHSMILVYYY